MRRYAVRWLRSGPRPDLPVPTGGRGPRRSALLAAACLLWLAAAPAGAAGTEVGSDLSAAAQGAMPGVVNLRAARIVRGSPPGPRGPFESDPFFQFFSGEAFFHRLRVPREHREQSLGSGVLVWPEGIILTSHRVVAGAVGLRVGLADRREVEATLVGADPKTDLAVLRIPGGPFPLLPLGDSDLLRVGEPVLAVGNPFGLGQTVSRGIISAVGRANLGIADYEDFLQTDAAITPGSAGGALVNTRGEVIGINTAIFSRSGGPRGLGFAIPSNMARAILEQILEHGRVVRGYLGVAVQELSPGVARAFGLGGLAGVLVTEVGPGGPEVHAGLQPGDILRGLNGIPVESPGQFRNLVAALAPGAAVTLTILRDGQPMALSGVIAEQPDDSAAGPANPDRG